MFKGETITSIYTILGSQSNPIKAVISRTGEVRLFGSKYSQVALLELELFNGNSLNNVSWKRTSSFFTNR